MQRTDAQQIHLIAIGGSIMHNLALALHQKGLTVTGSDDEIFDPAHSRLQAAGLLPEQEGWFPEKIHPGLDAVIVGMHARPDNPELRQAQQAGIPVYSFPEFIYEQSRDKQRIVIGGSHGKTSITSIIMHVLQYHGRLFDYAVGAQLEGFDLMVKITEEAPIIIIEGDEYLASPIQRVPKFHLYQHHIGIISGISWDHINVFPNEKMYRRQFQVFAEMTPKAGTLIYNQDDEAVLEACVPRNPDVSYIGYSVHEHFVKEVCKKIGVKPTSFYEALASFKGAARRLEKIGGSDHTLVYKDFAHAPSKLKATTEALKNQYPNRQLVACLELHTFSSLNKAFLPEYRHTFDAPDVKIVYLNPKALEQKQMEMLTVDQLREAFANDSVQLFTDSQQLKEYLLGQDWQRKNLLMMSSGNFGGLNLGDLASSIT